MKPGDVPLKGTSRINSNVAVYTSASGQIRANGCLSMLIKVQGAGTTFTLWDGKLQITETDAPIVLPYYPGRDSRRYDEINFARTVGTGSLIIITDVDLNCI